MWTLLTSVAHACSVSCGTFGDPRLILPADGASAVPTDAVLVLADHLRLRAELRRAPLRAAFEAMGLDDEAAPYWLNGRIVEMYKVLCDERHDTIDIEKVWGW